jgi:hypothetical protein
MKPYGQGDKIAHFWSKVDHHIREGHRTLKNWWESEVSIVKARARQNAKRAIRKEMEDLKLYDK